MNNHKILPLGTSGWMTSEGRETMCAAMMHNGALILLDCGTGARRLADPRVAPLVESAEKIFILISHYHLDHIVGLIFLPGLLRGRNVCIAGPGEELSGTTLFGALKTLTSFPLFSHDISGFPMDLELRELTTGANDLGHFTLTTRRQEHTAPSTGMRIDDVLTYATDTSPQDETITLARGCDVLLHECWLDSADYDEGQRTGSLVCKGHSHAAGAARIAAEADVLRLGLTHLNPLYGPDRLMKLQREARSIFAESHILVDMKEL